MGIGELSDRNVESLSKGLKQRVALGRAIVHDPQVLILDEPAANLDPRARIEFRTLIRELAADGKTILLSSHILTELAEMCDGVTVIEKGRILATGTVQEILEGVRQRRILSVRLAGPTSGIERFLLEQPGVLNVHEAGGAPAVRVRRRRRRAGGARRPPDRRRLPGARVQRRTAPASRICSSRSPKGGCNEPVAGASSRWLDDTSDWLSPIVVKEVRQVVRGREFNYSFGAQPGRRAGRGVLWRRRRADRQRHVRHAGRSSR